MADDTQTTAAAAPKANSFNLPNGALSTDTTSTHASIGSALGFALALYANAHGIPIDSAAGVAIVAGIASLFTYIVPHRSR